ncbi:integrin alpha-E isoform X1 [Ascaphus truei]|uniref:integrin alpha-E isoform X1 n=1 Tax=Ascaphus truei TaxID=8439 RepID=UPI003F599A02
MSLEIRMKYPLRAWMEPVQCMRTDTNLRCLLLLLILATTESFNIDTVKKWSYVTGSKSLFGQKVLQYKYGAQTGVFVSSPLGNIESRTFGGVYKCSISEESQNLHCEMMDLSGGRRQAFRKALPIVSLARNSDYMLTCFQTKRREARSPTEELHGMCTWFKEGFNNDTYLDLANIVRRSDLKKNTNNNNNDIRHEALLNRGGDLIGDREESSKGVQANRNNNNNVEEEEEEEEEEEDEESGTELAIVLDGSGSISPEDFQRAKMFISKMMSMFWEKCFECEFAVVQYGDEIRTEFDLRDSQNSEAALQKVQEIKQLGNVTKTASALQHVLDSIFHESHGSKKGTTKKILVLTDGEIFLDPLNLTTVIHSPKMKNIERFVIGVGDAFNKPQALNELKLIASAGDEHLIQVDDYSALTGLLSLLQQKIIAIEGTTGEELEFELAETGFAVHIMDKQSLVLGAVGAFGWSGGMILYPINNQEDKGVFLNESKTNANTERYSYLGYSVTTARGKHFNLSIAGAPRHSNVGKVLIFEKDIRSYHLTHKLTGEQLGSYFGSELCSLDINTDGITDFLLVGAPFYHIKGEEGRVYIYQLNQESTFTPVNSILEQQHYAFARFGYAIAVIGDINQDGYQDIAIGAPLEGHLEKSDSFGSVYIYNGHSSGIRSTASQRIRAADLQHLKLQYFGQSIDGGFDLTSDGYPDISVGGLGNVVVLRSRPVVKLQANVTFIPDKILPTSSDKWLRANFCFDLSPFNPHEFHKSVLVYTLDLDVKMEKKRITFENKEHFLKERLLPIETKCRDHRLIVLPCNYNCFSSIIIKITYTLSSDMNRDLPAPILDMYERDHKYVELPYVKNCNNNCVADLKLTTHLSEKELVVGGAKDLTMNLTLVNSGDDSYMTDVLITYPKNVHVKKISETHSTSIKCSDATMLLQFNSSMICNIGHPVFNKSSAKFSIIWQLDKVIFSTKEAIIDIGVSNNNEDSTPVLQQLVFPVKHSFTAVLTVPTPTIYVNISQGPAAETKIIQYTFNVNGENQFEAELVLNLQIPVEMQGFKIATVTDIKKTQNSTQCKHPQPCGTVVTPIGSSDIWNCEVSTCLCVECIITDGREDITVTAELFLTPMQQLVEDTKQLVVTGEILYNNSLFVDVNAGNHKDKIIIMLLKDKKVNILPVVIGSSIGGVVLLLLIIVILVKCGFFNRKYKNIDSEQKSDVHD